MRISSVLLRTGCLAAHRRHCLMLLGSPPDMIHSCRSRKTHSSSQPKTTLTTQVLPSFRESTPAVADCRYRAPLLPRLVWPYFTSYLCLGFIGIGGGRSAFPEKTGRILSATTRYAHYTTSSPKLQEHTMGIHFLFKYCSHIRHCSAARPRWSAVCCTSLSVPHGRERRF